MGKKVSKLRVDLLLAAAARVAFNDVLDANKSASKHGDQSEHHEKNILIKQPVSFAVSAVGRAVNDLDKCRNEESQAAEEDGTDQGDEWFEIGHEKSESSHNQHDECSENSFRYFSVLSQTILEFLEDDFHWNVELESKCEQNSETDENLSSDSRPFFSRKIQRDTGFNKRSVTNESKCAHDRVKNCDSDHRNQKNAWFA